MSAGFQSHSNPCGACGLPVRSKFPRGKGGKNPRLQHPRWWVCERGHQVYRKGR